MADISSADRDSNRLYSFSLNRPFTLIIILFLLAYIIKIFDSFIFRLDELVGEAILTKSLGFLLVAGYLWASGNRLRDMGFHKRFVGKALILTGVSFSAVYIAAFIGQLIAFRSVGEAVRLELTAVDPKTGMSGGFLFALWMFFTNLINSAMEEGLFRGLMIRHLMIKTSDWGAILISTGLFAIWHLSWPIRNYLDGASTLGEAGFEAFGLLIATSIAGIVYGYLYLKTNNLWAPFLGHVINNTVLNMLYFKTGTGLQAPTGLGIFLPIFLLGYLALLPVFNIYSKRNNLPETSPWGEAG